MSERDEKTAAGGVIDISHLTELADKAGSEIITINAPEGSIGLPGSIPAMLNRASGAVFDVRSIYEKWRVFPERKTGTAKALTLESFADLVNRHKTEDSAIFANSDWQKPGLLAVIDYHHIGAALNGLADNCGHRIRYDFPLSEEWKAWIAQDGEAMDQASFAEWIENHITELSAPSGEESDFILDTFGFKTAFPNELQVLSRGLQVHAETRVKSNVTLQSGEGEIVFEEEHRDAAGNKLSVPGMFLLSVAPFFMGETVRIPVRLRYRVRAGQVVWSFHIYRPDKHITEQVRADMVTVQSACELPVYEGLPEA